MKNIIVWIVSIFFILSFLIYTPYSIANILFLISGLVILPPITKLLQSKIPKFNNTIKWIIFSISFVLGVIVAPTTTPIGNQVDIYDEKEIVQIYKNTTEDFKDTVEIYNDSTKTNDNNDEINDTTSNIPEQVDNAPNKTGNANNITNNQSNNTNTITSNQNNNNTISNTDNNIPISVPSQNNEEIVTQTQTVPESQNSVTEEPLQPVIAVPTPITPTEQTVYITETGEKYHKSTCRHVKESCISISLSDALSRGYVACKVCKP